MLKKFKNWLNSQILRIQKSNDVEYLTEIDNLNEYIKALTAENVNILTQLIDTTEKVNKLTNDLISADKHVTLDNYQKWLDNNIAPRPTYYNFGSGRKQVHTIFAESIKDEEIIRDFTANDLEFDPSKYDTVDDIVYWFNRTLSMKFPTNKYYASDNDLYGTIEYWATAKQTILKLRKGGKSFDCDDSMTLRYSCLYYILKDWYPLDMWRLRGFIVDLWTGGGHALLAWVKEGPNDWIPIETTFFDDRERIIWNGNYRIRDQLFYQIRYSFDDEAEYVKI